jgi:hypothetical protein
MFANFILFIAIFSTIFFANYKFSKGIRIIAFQEEESVTEAVLSFLAMFVIIILWTVYFSIS